MLPQQQSHTDQRARPVPAAGDAGLVGARYWTDKAFRGAYRLGPSAGRDAHEPLEYAAKVGLIGEPVARCRLFDRLPLLDAPLRIHDAPQVLIGMRSQAAFLSE